MDFYAPLEWSKSLCTRIQKEGELKKSACNNNKVMWNCPIYPVKLASRCLLSIKDGGFSFPVVSLFLLFPLALFFFSVSPSFPPPTAGASVRQRDSALPAPLPESSFSVALNQHLHSLDKHVKGRGRNKTPTGRKSYTE